MNLLFDCTTYLESPKLLEKKKSIVCWKDNIKCKKYFQWSDASAVFFGNIAARLFWFLFSLFSFRILLLRYFSRLNLKFRTGGLNITVHQGNVICVMYYHVSVNIYQMVKWITLITILRRPMMEGKKNSKLLFLSEKKTAFTCNKCEHKIILQSPYPRCSIKSNFQLNVLLIWWGNIFLLTCKIQDLPRVRGNMWWFKESPPFVSWIQIPGDWMFPEAVPGEQTCL